MIDAAVTVLAAIGGLSVAIFAAIVVVAVRMARQDKADEAEEAEERTSDAQV